MTPAFSESVQKSQETQVIKRNQWIYEAINLKNGNRHIVTVQDALMMCDCPDTRFRHRNCKHMIAAAKHITAENMMQEGRK